ncbi:TspO/MBR family protein [Spirochaeta lutea]|uniref:TspO/MBR family protein n=1 Tax=Spirochaeta lutea TaxID=1480694 RepID=UPI000691BDC0|nr:TspO/MBR family protein [Spirochaeta lutea]
MAEQQTSRALLSARIWAFLAGISTILMITINVLANALPLNDLNTGELSDRLPNLFVPAGITFSIWGLIYILLIGFSVFALLRPEKTAVITPLYTLTSLLNIAWIFSWHWLQIGLSLVVMVGLLASLILIYRRLHPEPNSAIRVRVSAPEFWLVSLPFSVYLGWITVATVANITGWLVSLGVTGGSFAPLITIVVIAAVLGIGLISVLRQGDWGYSLVLIWALSGIVIKRLSQVPGNPEVGYAAGLAALVILGGMLVKTLRMRNAHDKVRAGESTPGDE